MKRKLFILFLLLCLFAILIVGAIIISFYYLDSYERLIRFLYAKLSSNNISLIIPIKDFRFPSDVFIYSIVIFISLLAFLLYKRESNRRLMGLIYTIVSLPISLVCLVFIDGKGKLMACTACNDGHLILRSYNINYDGIFILCLIIGLLPNLIPEIRRLIISLKRQK